MGDLHFYWQILGYYWRVDIWRGLVPVKVSSLGLLTIMMDSRFLYLEKLRFWFFFLTFVISFFFDVLLEFIRKDWVFYWLTELKWISLTYTFLFLFLLPLLLLLLLLRLNVFLAISLTFLRAIIFLLTLLFPSLSTLLFIKFLELFLPLLFNLKHLLNEQQEGFWLLRSYSTTEIKEWWDSSVWKGFFGNRYSLLGVLSLNLSVIYCSNSFFSDLNLWVCC